MTTSALPLRVTTAQQAAAFDQAVIAAGRPSFGLMLRAGTLTASRILQERSRDLVQGAAVYAGTGNNGGDAYIVAAQLARAGVRVRIIAAGAPRSDDAKRAAVLARAQSPELLQVGAATGRERLVVDGLLGTGHHGEFREPIATHVAAMAAARARGATILALDVPSGLDATTGECAAGMVPADLTFTYGTIKRGLLTSRHVVGLLTLLDIGLTLEHAPADAWQMADDHSLRTRLPQLGWNAHKGVRGHVAIVGGQTGMAGAVILAAHGALRSSIGLVRAYVEGESIAVVQQGVPQAIAQSWHATAHEGVAWGNALVVGPGLGTRAASLAILRRTLDENPGVPTVLDADALNLVAADGGDIAARLRAWCGERPLVLTPHPGEFSRLANVDSRASWTTRADAAKDVAKACGATIVLKGTPTVIVHPNQTSDAGGVRVTVVPRGTAVLATGGSGDLLSGIIGALLAQRASSFDAALLGTTVHGLAGEFTMSGDSAFRGATLAQVIESLPRAWMHISNAEAARPGVLTWLPAVE